MVELEEGRYLGPILTTSLAELLAGRRSEDDGATRGGGGGGGGGGGSGGNGSGGGSSDRKLAPKVGATGGPSQVWACYEGHLPSLSLWYGNNLWSILAVAVLPNLHIHIICKNWHLCGVCWEERERKNSHIPTPPICGNHHLRATQSGLGA